MTDSTPPSERTVTRWFTRMPDGVSTWLLATIAALLVGARARLSEVPMDAGWSRPGLGRSNAPRPEKRR